MSQKNLVITIEQLAEQFDIPIKEATELMDNLKYTTMMAMSDGQELVIFIPEKDSPNILEGKQMWDDLMKNAPTQKRLIELGIIKES